MARALIKLKEPINKIEFDLDEYELETIGYQLVKEGTWIYNNNNGFSYCSCCDAVSPHEDQYGELCDRPKYCPNCGAKMNK